MTFKKTVYEHCRQLITEKLLMHKVTLNDLVESSTEDGKSSSSDPSDAGIAMMQIEQANIHAQINEAMTMKTVIDTINPDHIKEVIAKGSLIRSGNNHYYMSVALGKINVDGKPVFVISPQSPLGSRLLGHEKGDAIEMNGNTIIVEEVS